MRLLIKDSGKFNWYKDCVGKVFDVTAKHNADDKLISYRLTNTYHNLKNVPTRSLYRLSGNNTSLGVNPDHSVIVDVCNNSDAGSLLLQSESEVK